MILLQHMFYFTGCFDSCCQPCVVTTLIFKKNCFVLVQQKKYPFSMFSQLFWSFLLFQRKELALLSHSCKLAQHHMASGGLWQLTGLINSEQPNFLLIIKSAFETPPPNIPNTHTHTRKILTRILFVIIIITTINLK